jgi:trimeric autotransporter adhesin
MMTIGRVMGFALAFALMTPAARAQTNNTATGTDALFSVTTGSYNTATGTKALYSNTTGYENTATGRRAMYSNVNGYKNTATGVNALYYNTSAIGNTATGYHAMLSNTTGDQNTAMGLYSLTDNTTGQYNTAMGAGALRRNTTAWRNTAYGQDALASTTVGGSNTAIGENSLLTNVAGQSNTGVGARSLEANVAGENTAVGNASLYINTTGYGNTAVGHLSLGQITTGSLNTAVGSGASTFAGDLSNTGAFGYGATPTASNTIVLGNSSIVSIGGYVAWSNLSDARVKTNVKENVPGLAFIRRLRPVTFTWDLDKLQAFEDQKGLRQLSEAERQAKAAKVHTGFLAQEVEAAARDSRYDFSGVVKPANAESRYELQYSQFVVPLVKAVQEQQKELDELRGIVRRLSSGAEQTKASIFGSASSMASVSFGVLLGAVLLRGARVRRRTDKR